MIWIPVIGLFIAIAVEVVTVFLNRAFFAHGIKDICVDRMRTADRCFDFYRDGRTVESDRPSGARGSLWGAVWNEQGEKGIIIFAHGMGNTAAWYLPEILAFAGMEYEVFAFEYHGYGAAGDFCGFPRAAADVEMAIDYISDGKRPIFLVGHSMGGYAVCVAAGRTHKPVAGVVAYAPFDRPDEVIAETAKRMRHPRLTAWAANTAQLIAFGAGSRRGAADSLNRADVPTLVMQGSSDAEVTPDSCSLYAHRERVRTPKVTFRLVDADGSNGHMTIVRRQDKPAGVNPDTFPVTAEFIESIAEGRE